MAALEALPLSVKASALPFAIFSAASPLLVSASAVASAICSAGCLAMAGNPSKTTSDTLPRSRWQDSDTSNASSLTNRPPLHKRTPREFFRRYGPRNTPPLLSDDLLEMRVGDETRAPGRERPGDAKVGVSCTGHRRASRDTRSAHQNNSPLVNSGS